MNIQFKHLAGSTLAALGMVAADASLAQTSTYDPSYRDPGPVVMTTTTRVVPSNRLLVKGTRSTMQRIPQYVDGTPENILGLPFDLASLERTVTVAMHPARLGNPEAPPVPFNLDTGYLGAPLIQSRG